MKDPCSKGLYEALYVSNIVSWDYIQTRFKKKIIILFGAKYIIVTTVIRELIFAKMYRVSYKSLIPL